ncbi:MAG TPA: hypothetical protein VMO20_09525, partial [Candidatus Acidoferrum sp.]|nr:hypothetical protein [Candidatus Acidoferrum sp.]
LVLSHLLDPQHGLPYAARAIIRTRLGMPAEGKTPPAGVSTNSVAPESLSSTNTPATNSPAQ